MEVQAVRARVCACVRVCARVCVCVKDVDLRKGEAMHEVRCVMCLKIVHWYHFMLEQAVGMCVCVCVWCLMICLPLNAISVLDVSWVRVFKFSLFFCFWYISRCSLMLLLMTSHSTPHICWLQALRNTSRYLFVKTEKKNSFKFVCLYCLARTHSFWEKKFKVQFLKTFYE